MKKYVLNFIVLLLTFQMYSFQEVIKGEEVVKPLQEITKEEKQEQLSHPKSFIPPTYKQKEVFSIKEVPNPKKNGANGFISDPNNYIKALEEHELNLKLWELEQKTTAQIVIVIVKSIGQEVPKNFAVKLFEDWGIGDKEVDNGLLILTVID